MALYNLIRSVILPLKEIDDFLPKHGLIIDLGCGRGVIAQYLAINKKRKIIGVDQNLNRLPNLNLKNLTFVNSDIRKYSIGRCDAIILSDVLHHLKIADQKKLLEKTFKALKNGGVLLIKEIDTREFLRSKLSRLWDFILYPDDKIYFWNAVKLMSVLKGIGYTIKFKRSQRLFPGSSNLFVCKK